MQGTIKDKIAKAFPSDQRERIQNLRSRLYIGDTASRDVLASYTQPIQKQAGTVHEAFFNQANISIIYTSEKKETLERIIEPHYLVLNWPVWYVLAWDHLRKDVRYFRIDRISKVSIRKERFILHHVSNFKKQLEEFSKSL